MISQNIIQFLELLKVNNNREWFHSNKILYDNAKGDFEIYTNYLINEIKNFDKSISYLEPKDCIFRIFRDIRFSKDKTPYKPNFGAYIVKGGKKSGYAGYYLHIEPNNSFLAGGVYMPQPIVLKAVRSSIYENIDEFLKIINTKSFKTYFGEIEGEKLKSTPPGFSKDFSYLELLKFKSYTLLHSLDIKTMQIDSFDNHVIKIFKEMYDFNIFINNCIEDI